MTWVDFLLLIVIVGTVYAGVRRGIVYEVADCAVLLLATAGAYATFTTLGRIISFIPWRQGVLNGLCWWVVFVLIAAAIVLLGMYIDRHTRAHMQKTLSEVGGAFIAFFKSFLLAFLVIILLSALPFTDSFRENMKTAPVVQSVQRNLTPFVYTYLDIFTSRDVARDQKAAITKYKF